MKVGYGGYGHNVFNICMAAKGYTLRKKITPTTIVGVQVARAINVKQSR